MTATGLLVVAGVTVAFVVALVLFVEWRARWMEWRERELWQLYREAVLEAADLDGLEPEDELELADVVELAGERAKRSA